MTALLHLRDAIARGLSQDLRLIALKANVSVHGGDFRLEDLKRYGKNAPAVILSLLHVDIDTEAGTGETWADCTFGVAVLTKPAPRQDQHAAAIELVDATLRAIRGSFWDELAIGAPQQLTARNLFGASLDAVGGVALWAIGFHQQVEIVDEDNSVPFLRWHATYDPIETDPERPHMEDQGELEQGP